MYIVLLRNTRSLTRMYGYRQLFYCSAVMEALVFIAYYLKLDHWISYPTRAREIIVYYIHVHAADVFAYELVKSSLNYLPLMHEE